jgi:hypothetical protein
MKFDTSLKADFGLAEPGISAGSKQIGVIQTAIAREADLG